MSDTESIAERTKAVIDHLGTLYTQMHAALDEQLLRWDTTAALEAVSAAAEEELRAAYLRAVTRVTQAGQRAVVASAFPGVLPAFDVDGDSAPSHPHEEDLS